MRPRFLSLLAALVLSPLAAAQPTDGGVVGRFEDRTASPGGYYVNAREGEPTIRVNVVGEVARAGVYELGRGFSLDDLFALAGGPTQDVRDGGRQTEAYVRLYRSGSTSRGAVYAAPVSALLDAGEDEVPALREGDVVVVEFEGVARVYVWGAVREPGLLEIGPGVDYRAALALAGGPILPSLDSRNERAVTVKIYRPSSSGTGLLVDTTLDAIAAGTVALPDPQDGDSVLVEVIEDRALTFRDFVSAIAAVSGVATAVILGIDRLGN